MQNNIYKQSIEDTKYLTKMRRNNLKTY